MDDVIVHINLKRTRKAGFVILGAVAFLTIASIFVRLPRDDFRKESVHSLRVLDRNGILLREFLNDDQGRGLWMAIQEIAPSVQQATLAAEDRRFFSHPGVDPLAIARAIGDNVKAGKIFSGGSTITQQVVRNVYRHPRTLVNKLLEAWLALRLERMMTKAEILEQYLNRVPYGNQLVGVEAAARHYFGKPARDLSLAESAFLAALPNAPTNLNPYRNLDPALARQKMILGKMLRQRRIQKDEYDRAMLQPLHIVPAELNFRASHAVEMAVREVRERGDAAVVYTTIDDVLQTTIGVLANGHLSTLAKKHVTNAAVVVLENGTGEIRTLLGSADYFDELRNGQVNGALALRQPGSSIKPFTYTVALEAGYSPATIIADLPVHIPDDRGDYIPENYDKRYHGPVRLRTALACSYNIPAVRVLQTIGREQLLQRLMLAGFTSLTQPAAYYGYGLTLGNGEVSLLELTNAYAVLADGGVWKPPKLVQSVQSIEGTGKMIPPSEVRSPRRVCDARTAFVLTDILSDRVARRPAFGDAFHFPFPCAVKTGTTKDYRDNWTVGYTTRYTVGVWVGNFDGSSMRGVSGITGAGQIFADVMMLLHTSPFGTMPEDFRVPPGLERRAICVRSGKLPTRNCDKTIEEWFFRGQTPTRYCDVHQKYRTTRSDGREVEMVYEVFPPEFQAWCKEQQFPQPPDGSRYVALEEKRGLSLGHTASVRLAIVSPNDGDQFRIDPILKPEFQAIKVIALIPDGCSNVVLRIDGKEEIAYQPTGVWWRLSRGQHRLQLTSDKGKGKISSKPITVTVK